MAVDPKKLAWVEAHRVDSEKAEAAYQAYCKANGITPKPAPTPKDSK